MARKYERYVVSKPKRVQELAFHGRRAEPFDIYMSKELVPEANAYVDVYWRKAIPKPNPTCEMHSHDAPQLLLYIGEEGTFEVEVPLEDEVYKLTKTTAIWIPPGVRHNVKYNKVKGVVVEVGVTFKGAYP